MKLDHLLTPHTRVNSKWIRELTVRPETIKILEKNIGSKILDIACSNFLSDVFPQAKETRKNKQMGLHQTKKFLHSKGNHQQNEKTTTEWENIFTDTSVKGLISKIYKELTKLNTKKTPNPIKKWTEDLNTHFSKKDILMANRHMKRCLMSLIIREMQIK